MSTPSFLHPRLQSLESWRLRRLQPGTQTYWLVSERPQLGCLAAIFVTMHTLIWRQLKTFYLFQRFILDSIILLFHVFVTVLFFWLTCNHPEKGKFIQILVYIDSYLLVCWFLHARHVKKALIWNELQSECPWFLNIYFCHTVPSTV